MTQATDRVQAGPATDPSPGRGLRRPGAPAVQLPALAGAQAAVQLGVALVSARWLGPTGRGDLVLATTLATLLLLVSSQGMGIAARTLLAEAATWWSWNRYLRLVGGLCLAHLVVLGSVGLLLLDVFTAPSAGVRAAFVGYGVAALAAHLVREGLHGLGRHRTSIGVDVLAAVVQLAAIGLCHAAGVLSAAVALLVGGGCYLAAVLAGVVAGRRAAVGRPAAAGDRQWRAQLHGAFRFGRPAMVSSLGQSVVVNGDRLVLGVLGATAAVGVYSAAASLASLAWVVPQAVTAVLTRRTAAVGDLSVRRRLHLPLLAVTTGLATAVAATGWVLLPVLLGPSFAGGRPVVLVLSLAAVPYASYLYDSAALAGLRDLRTGALGAALGCPLLVVGCAVGYLSGGPVGLAGGVLTAYLAMAVLARVRLQRRARLIDGPG